jgi:glycosyltransferase involved in cell wall biosynthesis
LILSQWCTPEPDLKALPFAKELIKNGHYVEILTGFPNYPGGKVYDGYKVNFYKKEIIDEVVVHRCYLYPSHDQSAIKRILNYFSFAFSSAIIGVIKLSKFDIVYTYHPPGTISFSAAFIKFFKGSKIVYDIQDLWPDTLTISGMLNSNIILNGIEIYFKIFYKYCDHIVVLSNGFKQRLVKKGVNEKKITRIYNWALIRENKLVQKPNEFSCIEEKIITFAGTMGTGQSLETILDTANLCLKDNIKFHFVFIGGGIEVENLKKYSEEKNLGNVTFISRVNSNIIINYLEYSDLLLVHLKDDPLFQITIPSKIQAYLKIGKPILCGIKGESAELIEESDSGYIFEPDNSIGFFEILKSIDDISSSELKLKGENGKKYYQEFLSIEKGIYRNF